nr:FtsX-like permease family protein [Corynebacterium cystitidis]
MVLSTQSTNRHNALLCAIGAQDSIPRRITAAFAAIVALLGTAAGTLTSLIAAWLFGSSSEIDAAGNLLVTGTREFMEVPWSLVGLLVVLTPLLAYVIGLMLHRQPGLEVAYRLS